MSERTKKRILIIGAGEAGRMVAGEIGRHPELEAEVAGFLDDDPGLEGGTVLSLPVLGRILDLEKTVASLGIDETIMAIPTASGRLVRDTVRRCRRTGVPYKIVPGVMEIIKGDVHIDQIREVRVEDLLGRETVDFDIEGARKALEGKRILVTGAGGSIGSELSRQLAKVSPSRLILLGRGENRIFDIEDELRQAFPSLDLGTVIANLTDEGRIRRIMKDVSPHVVYHAAAHKHVHYMERDPEEAVINNIEGSVNLIEAARLCSTEKFVFISTDKAAEATGVMGASKKIIEMYLRSRPAGECRFITVRFGNVMGSAGSVVPLFLRQILRGGPLTVSHPDATRYFMTVKEAAFLVIRSSLIGGGGETYILDMGEAVNIMEMAKDMIILSGHDPDSEIQIDLTGLRDGERLHENLAGEDESLEPSGEEKIFLARSSRGLPADLDGSISALIESARRGEREEVLRIMARLVPELRGDSGKVS